mgnify:CR=1 FL=1
MIEVRVFAPERLCGAVEALLSQHPAVTGLAVMRGASVKPNGDVFLAQLPREVANDVVRELVDLKVQAEGLIEINEVGTWVSAAAYRAELEEPGSSDDSVVWAQVVQEAYEDTTFSWTYASFMILATLLASIAILTDSVVLVIGSMVLGPEFVAVAALGLALVRRRRHLLQRAINALVLGFALSIAVTTLIALGARLLGLIDVSQVNGPRPGTSFIYQPNVWSIVIALIAGAAGVLALTSNRTGGLAGVFISVTTIPASGNMALALAFGLWHDFWGSALQLVINIIGMALAGWGTLLIQQHVWARVTRARARRRRPQRVAP